MRMRRGLLTWRRGSHNHAGRFLQCEATPSHFGGWSLRSSLMRMVYLPGTEETTITQAVPPVRGHSTTLRGLVPAVAPPADAPGILTWRRGSHNHAGRFLQCEATPSRFGGWSLRSPLLRMPRGYSPGAEEATTTQGGSSSARPLHHASGVGPCGRPSCGCPGDTHLAQRKPQPRRAVPPVRGHSITLRGLVPAVAPPADAPGILTWRRGSHNHAGRFLQCEATPSRFGGWSLRSPLLRMPRGYSPGAEEATTTQGGSSSARPLHHASGVGPCGRPSCGCPGDTHLAQRKPQPRRAVPPVRGHSITLRGLVPAVAPPADAPGILTWRRGSHNHAGRFLQCEATPSRFGGWSLRSPLLRMPRGYSPGAEEATTTQGGSSSARPLHHASGVGPCGRPSCGCPGDTHLAQRKPQPRRAVPPVRGHSITLRGLVPAVAPPADAPGILTWRRGSHNHAGRFLQCEATPSRFGGWSLRSPLLRMPRGYSPGAEEATTTQGGSSSARPLHHASGVGPCGRPSCGCPGDTHLAQRKPQPRRAVPPVRGHSITLRGLVPAVAPPADAPGILTWRRGSHNHAGRFLQCEATPSRFGGWSLRSPLLRMPRGYSPGAEEATTTQGGSSSARPLHHASGVGPCGRPSCGCPGDTHLAQRKPQPRRAVPPVRGHSITLRGLVPAVAPPADAPGILTWRRGSHNHAGRFLQCEATPSRFGGWSLRSPLLRMPRGYSPGAEEATTTQGGSSSARPLHHASGVGPCGRPSCGCPGDTHLAQRKPQPRRAVPPVRGHSITLRGLVPAVAPPADAPGILTWRRGSHNHAGRFLQCEATPSRFGGWSLRSPLLRMNRGYSPGAEEATTTQGGSSSARPLHHTSGVGPCGHP